MTAPRRPRLALPFTVLTEPDTVRLVAGEDFRYTLTGPGLDGWLPALLMSLDGRRAWDEVLQGVDAEHRAAARQLLDRLFGERVLVDGPAVAVPGRFTLAVEGTGKLADLLRPNHHPNLSPLNVLCQDRLDYQEALDFNRRRRAAGGPYLWATTGPMGRGYVSPVFWPDAGPCLACLLRHFQRLSPAPEIYDSLIRHAKLGRPVGPVPFPELGVAILKELVLWKADLLARPEGVAATYRLHVLEAETLEVTGHAVLVDPECPECREAS